MLDPVGERIVVKRLMKSTTNSGLVIPDSAKNSSLVGKVMAKGPDADWVDIGDLVLFAKFSGFTLPVDGQYVGREYDDCVLMNCEDILAHVTGVETEMEVA